MAVSCPAPHKEAAAKARACTSSIFSPGRSEEQEAESSSSLLASWREAAERSGLVSSHKSLPMGQEEMASSYSRGDLGWT